MKKITLLITLFCFQLGYSQVLNQAANWPNENWTTSGEYTATALIAEPSTSDSFTFDDDAAGNTSLADVIASESPIIDLTAAFNAGETFITVSGDFSHYYIGGYLAVEYFDADTNEWLPNLQDQLESTTTTATDYQNCDNLVGFEKSFAISNFTANQLENFKYRFSYNDTQGWQWGFCIKNPSIMSSSNSDCPEPDVFSWTMGTVSASFNGTNNSAITSYEIEYNQGETFTPGDGTAQVYTFNEFPHTLEGLEPGTLYYFTMRSICGDDNFSEWSDSPDNGDGPDPWETTSGGGDNCDPSSLPYFNDFSDLASWEECNTFFDSDGDGINWNNATYDDGTVCALSQSWSAGAALSPDNWVIIGPIDLTNESDVTMEWLVRGVDPSYCEENYSVYVGTEPSIENLTNSSVSYTETIAGTGDACGNAFAQRSLDISAAGGTLVYIGFRHHDISDMYVLNIDDLSIFSGSMSIQDPETLEMNIYPNPVNGNFVTIQTPISGVKYVEVFDITGKRLINTSLSADTLEVSSLSAGMYLINVTVEGQSKTSKLVVR